MVPHSTFSRASLLFLLLPALPWLSCGSTPEKPKANPAVEQHFRDTERMRLERLAKSQNFQQILLDMDKALTEYVGNLERSENEQAQRKEHAWANWLVTNVSRYRSELRLLLQDPESARARQIAAAALGFDRGNDKNQDTLNTLVLSLASEKNAAVRTNICLGLGIYASPLTPLDKLFEIVLDPREELGVRQSASWALLQIQTAGAPKKGFARTWGLILEGQPYKRDPKLALNAIQGLGRLRDPAQLMHVVPYLTEPTALLQQAACVAVSRMDSPEGAQYVLPLLGRAEPNVNVKLFARKTLQDLAGKDIDHEYDWKAWAREFHLEGDPETGFKPQKKKDAGKAG